MQKSFQLLLLGFLFFVQSSSANTLSVGENGLSYQGEQYQKLLTFQEALKTCKVGTYPMISIDFTPTTKAMGEVNIIGIENNHCKVVTTQFIATYNAQTQHFEPVSEDSKHNIVCHYKLSDLPVLSEQYIKMPNNRVKTNPDSYSKVKSIKNSSCAIEGGGILLQ